MLMKYIEVAKNDKTVKPITNVRFKVDYDITNILRLWGNWSRKDYYLEQKTLNFYNTQHKRYKEVCSDNDGLLIDSILQSMSKVSNKAREQYQVLMLSYFGEECIIEDYVASSGAVQRLGILIDKKIVQPDESLISNISMKDFNKQVKHIIKPLSVVDIAAKMGVDRAKIKAIKEGGENHIVGHLSALTLLTGEQLEIIKHIKHI